jgi:hypothetical protein
MGLNPFFVQDTIPTTSLAVIREFLENYLAAIGAAKPSGWADLLGDMIPTDSPLVTFPISQLRTRYVKTEGESKYKKLLETSFDVKTEEFDDGYQARVYDLLRKVYAYRKWTEAPGRLVLAEEQHRHNQIALIMDGSGTRGGAVGSANDPGGVSRKGADGVNFFSTSHPVNLTDGTAVSQTTGSATWSNYQSNAKNVLGSLASANTGPFATDLIQAEVTAMKTQVPDENGYLLDVNPDTILVPTDYQEPLVIGLNNSRMIESTTVNSNQAVAAAAVENPYKGRFNVVGCKEFTQTSGSTADWYLIDSKLAKQAAPWLSMRENVAQSLALRVFDESSDFFKNTGDVKISSHIWYGFSLVLPHCIRRIKGPTR